ncbi:hypothetical protein A2159_00060 [Candidatus Woesebacteria bacterium RBG_13_34_9]|uniref:Glycosyltransferase RgtA/B/C/D-like domain-containing protein n=1 Tax=Candidatus Woesebacteria bacterium RBG_13_34_9 TaxID=1802477 RepID=A0A1F7X3S6_9BACT|nr:MAG: hypothetical protein A2159_00060 [Candidatus Woesebacteria bacterium RBG_13_34_9]
MISQLFQNLKQKKCDLVVYLLFLLISILLMFKTFKVDNGNMIIASKLWSDFAATIPLIRSFSLGNNFPPQYPLFAGPPIRYHFLFYFIVGMLEKIGLRIDISLNLLSTIGFFLLLLAVYKLAITVFKSRIVATLSVIFFLFNGSLSFLEFFKKNPLSIDIFKKIISNTQFPSFGPYDGKIVSAFWNLNIYTNQRHLALAYAFFIFLLIIFYKANLNPKNLNLLKVLLLAILVGLFPFFHLAVFAMIETLLLISLIVFPKIRKQVIFISLLSIIFIIPQILYMGKSNIEVELFNPGYLVENLNITNFIKYWFLNLGLGVVLPFVGFFLARKNQRKIFIPFISLFIVGNLFKFSPEIAANHKFFNLYIVGANIFAAYTLVTLFQKNIVSKIIVPLCFLFLTLSGIIDFFPIINDSIIKIEDIPNNKVATFIKKATPKDAVFLNSSFLYNPASLAGRKIFIGWPYFAWSAGYDTEKRGRLLREFYSSHDKNYICTFLDSQNISFFTTEDTQNDNNFPEIDLKFFKNNFSAIYSDDKITIFKKEDNCI